MVQFNPFNFHQSFNILSNSLCAGIVDNSDETGFRHPQADPRIRFPQRPVDRWVLAGLFFAMLQQTSSMWNARKSFFVFVLLVVNLLFFPVNFADLWGLSEELVFLLIGSLWCVARVKNNLQQEAPVVVHHIDCTMQRDALSCPAPVWPAWTW